ncbi:MAG TPA: glycoside hydrolase family 43 protein [Edaphobacter sp.]|nr:glycoside hydrolase family 43 protein [Edaphobacter sp.]
MKKFVVVWGLLLLMVGAAAAWGEDAYVFAYFKEPGSQGIYLALSRDGYKFEPLNDGQPWVKPEAPGEIMRDVFLTRNPSGEGFRMVWTWGWRGSSLGYAESKDLMTWSAQKEVPMMKDFPTVHNVWAPETYWDAKAKEWLILWSSSFSDKAEGHRIWASRTKDFVAFTKPGVFFDPGFVVIDATMFRRSRDWVMVFKDQTMDPLRYQVRWASGPSVEGPWGELSGPITESWSEGASVVKVGDEFVVYYDHYRAPRARYEGVQTKDWVHWESVNDRMSFPESAKHGSFFRVSEAEAQRLLGRHDGAR